MAVVEHDAPSMVLARLKKNRAIIPIQGVTPLIPHKWSEKAKRMMLDKQQGKAVQKKSPKSPEQEAHDATYWMPDGKTPAMPAVAFKSAIADAADAFDGITIKATKKYVFVKGDELTGELVPILGEITMREDMPRNATGVADLRYRNQIWPWSADLEVEYVESVFTIDAILALVDAAGLGGIGDWRPSAPKSKSGTFGRFEVTGEIL